MKRVASANESETNRDSRSMERSEGFDADVVFVMGKRPFHFLKLDMTCHTGRTGGGPPRHPGERACRGVALNQDSLCLFLGGVLVSAYERWLNLERSCGNSCRGFLG